MMKDCMGFELLTGDKIIVKSNEMIQDNGDLVLALRAAKIVSINDENTCTIIYRDSDEEIECKSEDIFKV